MVKVGIIGNGYISASHRKAYRELTEAGTPVQVEAVADIRPEFTAACEGKERIYRDYGELLENEVGKLDYVDICLPTFLHSPAAVKALDMGYNVLCEKPMAIDTAAAQAMCEAAKRSGRKLMIAQSWRFNPQCTVMREYVQEKKLGRVKCAHFNRNGGTPGWSWEGWHFDEKRSGGALLDLHMHDIDEVLYFCGNYLSPVTNALVRLGAESFRDAEGHIDMDDFHLPPVYFDATVAPSVSYLIGRIFHFVETQDIGCIVLDNLQDIQGGPLKGRRESQLNATLQLLKAIAEVTFTVVIVLSRINYPRRNRPLTVDDLQEAPYVEKYCDQIILIDSERPFVEEPIDIPADVRNLAL